MMPFFNRHVSDLLTAIKHSGAFRMVELCLSFKINWLIALPEDEAKTLSNASDGA